MDSPESVVHQKDETASRYLYPSATNTVALKKGLDLQDLPMGTTFEVDNSQKQPEELVGTFDPEEIFKQLNFECNTEEDDGDLSPFERMAEGMTDLRGDRGVLKKILRAGTGAVVPEGAHVRVHYNGYFEYSEEPFDSSRLRGKQFVFRLGHGEVLPGWDFGVQTMRRGEIARFLVQPQYGFGELGCPPRIPENAVILFEIELISFIDHKAADDFEKMSEQEKEETTLMDLLKVAAGEREAGNDFFLRRMLGRAMNKYNRAINILEAANLADEAEERLWTDALVKLYLNLALCCVQQHKPGKAITACKRLLGMKETNAKGLYLMGRAYHQLNEFELSRTYLARASRLKPNDPAIRKAVRMLEEDVQKCRQAEKERCARMFPGLKGLVKAQRNEKRLYTPEDWQLFVDKLRAFKSSALRELPFPSGITAAEKQCISDVAEELGLMVTSIGEGAGASVKVSK